jgi:hypothetical protein
VNQLRTSLGLLTLSTLLIACPEPPLTHTLEASLGTYAQQASAGPVGTTLGTGIVVKLRSSNGELPARAASVTVRGPIAWNDSAAVTFIYPAGAYWVTAPQTKATPVAGSYIVETVVGEERLTSTVNISEKPEAIATTTITGTVKGIAPNQTVSASWTPVPNATGYYARVIDGTLGVPASDDVYTLEPRATFSVGTLNPARAYFITVIATNYDTVMDNPVLPPELRMSDSIAGLSLEQSNTTRVQRDDTARRSILRATPGAAKIGLSKP